MRRVYKMMVNKDPKLLNYPVTILSYVAFIPLSLIQRPLWDGALSKHAAKSTYYFLNKEAIDYGIPSLYFHEQGIVFLSKLFGIDYYVIYNLIIAITLGVIFQQIKILAKNLEIVQESRRPEKLAIFLFIFFPAFHTLFSTQNFFYILCLAIFLIGLNLFLDNSHLIKYLGVVLIIYSFQMASLPFIFLVIYWWHRWKVKKDNFVTHFFVSAIFAVSILWIFRENFFPPRNLYVHYNEVVLNRHFLKMTFFNISNFLLFFALPTIFLGLTAKCLNLRLRVTKSITDTTDLVFIFLLTLASAFPYIMANKSPKAFDFFDWSWRHSFLLIIPLTLYTFKLKKVNEADSRMKRFRILACALACLVFTVMTIVADYGHVQSMVYDKHVLDLLSEEKVWTKSEIVCFQSSVKRMNTPRFYELNEIAWESTGKTNWQFYPDASCNSQNIPSGSLKNSVQLSGMTDSQWRNVYMGGTKNSKWIAIHISGKLDIFDIVSSALGSPNNPLIIKFSNIQNGIYKGPDEKN